MAQVQVQTDSAKAPVSGLSRPSAPLEPLLSVTGPFWRGRNLRRLLFVLLPFAALCILTYKMLSGEWINFFPDSYGRWTLGASFLFPLNIYQTLAQVLVLSLLLSVLMVLPLLAAQSFGTAPAVLFVACVHWLAHLPMMALFLLAGIFLAGSPMLLKRSKFYAALLGLFPVAVYLFVAVLICLAWSGQALVFPSVAGQGRYGGLTGGSDSLFVTVLLSFFSPVAVCIFVPLCMLAAFIIGLPRMLATAPVLTLFLVLVIVGVYATGSAFFLAQPGKYHGLQPVVSAAELVWPEMARAGQTSRQSLVNLSPVQQTWLYAPALLAVCLALVLLPILQLVHRWTNWPSAVMALATSALALIGLLLFHYLVFPETLNYAVLRARFEPNSILLQDFPDLAEYQLRLEQYRIATDPMYRLQVLHQINELKTLRDQAEQPNRKAQLDEQINRLDREFRYHDEPGRSAALLRQISRLFTRLTDQFEDRVDLSKRACIGFLRAYPYSRHKPHVLYMQAMATDARLDLDQLRRKGTVYVYYQFPSPESKAYCLELTEKFPDNILACPAGLRLGKLLAREGRFDQALSCLDRSAKVGQAYLASQSNRDSDKSFLGRLGLPPREPISAQEVSAVILQIQQLTELIQANYQDPLYGSEPLRRFCTKDPQQTDYQEQITVILDEFPQALVADHIRLQVILAQPAEQQLPSLRSAVNDFTSRLARKDALFHLAQLEMNLAASDPKYDYLRDEAVKDFRQFLQQYPQSYQARLAEEHLARLSLLSPPDQS